MKTNKKILIFFIFIVFLAGIFAMFSLNDFTTKKIENMEGDMNNTEDEGEINNREESSVSTKSFSCPDTLVNEGDVLMLYNSNTPLKDGVNPISFANLDEYIQYNKQQSSEGMDCPVLYLQKENNTQGQYTYRVRPSPFDLQGGLPTMPTMIPKIYPNENDSSEINQYYSGTKLSGPIPPQPTLNIIKVLDASRENGNYNTNQYAGFDPQGLYVGKYTNIDQIHDSTHMNGLSDNPMDPNWAGIEYTNNSIMSGKYADNNVSRPLMFQPRGRFDPNLPGVIPPPKDII